MVIRENSSGVLVLFANYSHLLAFQVLSDFRSLVGSVKDPSGAT